MYPWPRSLPAGVPRVTCEVLLYSAAGACTPARGSSTCSPARFTSPWGGRGTKLYYTPLPARVPHYALLIEPFFFSRSTASLTRTVHATLLLGVFMVQHDRNELAVFLLLLFYGMESVVRRIMRLLWNSSCTNEACLRFDVAIFGVSMISTLCVTVISACS